MRKVFTFIIGAWLSIIGFCLVIGQDYHLRGVKLDFGGANIIVGVLLFVIGISVIIFALRRKVKDFEDKVAICSQCGQTSEITNVSNMRCPKCDGKLEDLDGFFDRHPELRKR